MTTITEFIAARLAEKEQRARHQLRIAQDSELACGEPQMLGRRVPGWHSWPDVAAMCEQSIREVAAMRVILAEHPHPPDGRGNVECHTCGWDMHDGGWPGWCLTVRALGAIWSDHPDYDPSWTSETADAR